MSPVRLWTCDGDDFVLQTFPVPKVSACSLVCSPLCPVGVSGVTVCVGNNSTGSSKHLFVFLILSLKKISLSFLVLLCSHACLLVGTSTICLIMIIKNISTPRHPWMNTKRRRAGSSWKPSARRLYLMHNFCPATYSHWQKCLYPSVITLMRMFVRKWMIGANEIVHRADTESRHYSPFIYTKKASSSSRLYHSGLRHR